MDELFEREYPFVTSDWDVQKLLHEAGRRLGVTISIDPSIKGEVSVQNADGTLQSFLDKVTSEVRAIWWYDGSIVHIEPQKNLVTALIASEGMSIEAINEELERLNLADSRFPLYSSGDGSVVRLAGPAGYVEQVRELVTALNATRAPREADVGPMEFHVPKVYHGRDAAR